MMQYRTVPMFPQASAWYTTRADPIREMSNDAPQVPVPGVDRRLQRHRRRRRLGPGGDEGQERGHPDADRRGAGRRDPLLAADRLRQRLRRARGRRQRRGHDQPVLRHRGQGQQRRARRAEGVHPGQGQDQGQDDEDDASARPPLRAAEGARNHRDRGLNGWGAPPGRGRPTARREERVSYSSIPGYSGWRPSTSAPRSRLSAATLASRTYLALDAPPELAAGVVAPSTAAKMSAISSSSSGPNPSVVSAGVPIRMPEVYQAPLASRGMLFLLVTTPAARSADSAWGPVRPKLVATSASTRWLLVPPVTNRTPRRSSPSAR